MAKLIGGLESTVKSLTSQWRGQDQKASLGRRDLHQKIDSVVSELHALKVSVSSALADIAFMRPIVDGVIEARQQVQGAVKAGRWFHWLVFGSGGGAAVLWVASHFVTVTLK